MQQDLRVESIESNDSAGQWMDVLDASKATGLSPATLRRYIKRKKLKFKKLGRSANAKIQVLVTPELLNDSLEDQLSMDGLEDVLTAEEDDPSSQLTYDQVDYANRETMSWLRDRLDEQGEKLEIAIRERDERIESLQNQLQAATFRNGYLEAKCTTAEEQLKLLVDKKLSEPSAEERVPDQTPTVGGGRRLWDWLLGRKQK